MGLPTKVTMTTKRFTPTRQPVPLPGARVLGLDCDDEFQMAKRIHDGFSTATVSRLAKGLGVPDSSVLVYADIPESTFRLRKRQGKPLSADVSGRVYRLAKVFATADGFFEGNQGGATRWLTNPKTALGGAVPLEFARSPEGSDYIVKLLWRMAHGINS